MVRSHFFKRFEDARSDALNKSGETAVDESPLCAVGRFDIASLEKVNQSRGLGPPFIT